MIARAQQGDASASAAEPPMSESASPADFLGPFERAGVPSDIPLDHLVELLLRLRRQSDFLTFWRIAVDSHPLPAAEHPSPPDRLFKLFPCGLPYPKGENHVPPLSARRRKRWRACALRRHWINGIVAFCTWLSLGGVFDARPPHPAS